MEEDIFVFDQLWWIPEGQVTVIKVKTGQNRSLLGRKWVHITNLRLN